MASSEKSGKLRRDGFSFDDRWRCPACLAWVERGEPHPVDCKQRFRTAAPA